GGDGRLGIGGHGLGPGGEGKESYGKSSAQQGLPRPTSAGAPASRDFVKRGEGKKAHLRATL
ncbi:MAG TPA: hypothetical protein PKX87_08810, partial [Alphaproteobacteria bacterium]|nr:hypothetical protein [Alphaproteobacteria bacterium]